MSEQISLFPVGDYTDRPDYTDVYYLPTSTRTKRPIKKGAIRQRISAQTSINQVNQGT